MRAALYDVSKRECPLTFDYYAWQCLVKAKGYDTVTFKNDVYRLKKYPGGVDEAKARFSSILWPGPNFACMSRATGTTGDFIGKWAIPDIVALGLEQNIPRMKSATKSLPGFDYTVTLRHMKNKEGRNSDRALWIEFAYRIGATIIPDYFDVPIALHHRFSMYAGARMNYGVMGGPLAMLLWTPYPISIWCDPECEPLIKSMKGHGCEIGQSWPFMLQNQKLIWQKPTLDALMAEFERIHHVCA